jgi:hypothetical protein
MKNRYIKYSHISEGKFMEILRLFGADLTAIQISELAKNREEDGQQNFATFAASHS